MGAAAEILRPVCGAAGCRAGASVELPFCRACLGRRAAGQPAPCWRALPPETRLAITRQWRIGYGTGEMAATFQTAEAVRNARNFLKCAAPPTQPPSGAARKLLAEAELAVRSARVIEAASTDLLRRAEACADVAAGRAG